MGHGRADKAGHSLAQDVEEASAGNGQAQPRVPTFWERRKYDAHEGLFCFYFLLPLQILSRVAVPNHDDQTNQTKMTKNFDLTKIAVSAERWEELRLRS